jgi:hypothetical protein
LKDCHFSSLRTHLPLLLTLMQGPYKLLLVKTALTSYILAAAHYLKEQEYCTIYTKTMFHIMPAYLTILTLYPSCSRPFRTYKDKKIR